MCISMDDDIPFSMISSDVLVDLLESETKMMLIDGRPFMEHNTNKIKSSINVNCSRLVKRRLQQGKIGVLELLRDNAESCKSPEKVVVYDDQTENGALLSSDHFISVLLNKLAEEFKDVHLLQGGFLGFYSKYPSQCDCVQGSALNVDGVQRTSSSSGPTVGASCTSPPPSQCRMTALSQPTMPVPEGPTKILPHVYIGSEEDALRTECLARHGITHILNVSRGCGSQDYVPSSHFLRIAVEDTYSERLLPHFEVAFRFMDKVKQANGRVLVHCLAGISRSPTCVIAYIMKSQRLSFEMAYRYVKERRVQISPNFNFLGQLAQFENRLKNEQLPSTPPTSPSEGGPGVQLPNFENCPFVRLASFRRKLAEREAERSKSDDDTSATPCAATTAASLLLPAPSDPGAPPNSVAPQTAQTGVGKAAETSPLRNGLHRELSLPESMADFVKDERSPRRPVSGGTQLNGRGLCSCLGDPCQPVYT